MNTLNLLQVILNSSLDIQIDFYFRWGVRVWRPIVQSSVLSLFDRKNKTHLVILIIVEYWIMSRWKSFQCPEGSVSHSWWSDHKCFSPAVTKPKCSKNVKIVQNETVVRLPQRLKSKYYLFWVFPYGDVAWKYKLRHCLRHTT